MQQFSESMCGCTDRACAERVNQELSTWAESPHEQPTREERDANTKYTEQYPTCMQKYMPAATPAAAPAAPDAGSAAPAPH